jgi:hypothetical protein
MTLIDERGRVFGRVNLVDALVVVFLLGLIPVAYATYLLFQPATPRIESVTRTEITMAERRTSPGNVLSAKFKVAGSGFNPLLRAMIGDTPALSFVFETPNSADILVGEVPPGTHDLVLFDGVQEVARARNAIEIHPLRTSSVRIVGRFPNLPRDDAERLAEGMPFPGEGVIVAVGAITPAHLRVEIGTSAVDLPIADRVERGAVLDLPCDPGLPEEPCAIGGRYLSGDRSVTVVLPGFAVFTVDEVLPATPPTVVRIRARLAGGAELDLVTAGDRDAFLDERAARIESLGDRSAGPGIRSLRVVLRAGLDASNDGWRYRGRLVRPGVPITIDTGAYVVNGIVEALEPIDAGGNR